MSNLPKSKIKCCNVSGLTKTVTEKINLVRFVSLLKFTNTIIKKTIDKRTKKNNDNI